MKKLVVCLCLLISGFILSGCGAGKDLTEYVSVKFSGMDTSGEATYGVDEDKLIKDLFGDDYKPKDVTEFIVLKGSYSVKLDKSSGLSNGDKVKITVTVDEKVTNKIKGGTKTFTVKNLREPKKLTTKEVESKLIINFNGVSGRGVAKIDNLLPSPLNYIDFKIKNDTKLENGVDAEIEIDNNLKNQLASKEYVLEKGFAPKFKVSGLKTVAKTAGEITNLEDIKRMIDEGVRRKFQNRDYSNTTYDIRLEKLMYRQFDDTSSTDPYYSSGINHGHFLGVYTIEAYLEKDGGRTLKDTATYIWGYSGIFLDEQGNANISEIEERREEKDNTYSLESVLKMYEAKGYKSIE